MSEASPYSIDIAKMRNALLPSLSSRLQCYGNDEVQLNFFGNSGNDEVQLEISEGSMQMNDLNGHLYSNGFNMGSRVVNNDNQLGKGIYTQPNQSQSLIYNTNHQPGSLYAISSSTDISQQSLLLEKDPSISEYEGVSKNARKRPFEYVDNMSLWNKMKSNSKSKITFLEPKWHQVREASEITPQHKLHVPMKKNQKMSDKVTTLQKLVSPFGKTDTASVLHEASLHIKLLQAQIGTLYQMLSLSYINTVKGPHTQECGNKLQLDLRSRGLCLVPISITQKVAMEDQILHASASRIILH